jgi:uncharacterized protein GlcG (DUF336 family)
MSILKASFATAWKLASVRSFLRSLGGVLTTFIAVLIGVGYYAELAFAASPLNLAQVNRLLATGIETAQQLKAPGGTLAIVDAGGAVIAVQRMDNTFAASAPVAIGKARTAAEFQKSTSALEKTINDGRDALLSLVSYGYTPLQGGVPLVVDGVCIGAIGVSGAASAAQDEEIATAIARALPAVLKQP